LLPEPWPEIVGYELIKILGAGSTSTVFAVRHLESQSTFALKLFRSGESEWSEMAARFYGDAEALSNLVHPNIVRGFGVEVWNDRPYILLELLECSLDKKLHASNLLSRGDAITIVEVLARAVDYVHQKGFIHRDLKPANILLTSIETIVSETETVKINDFGSVRYMKGTPNGTRFGTILGTPGYMSPEQALGDLANILPQTDVFGLGAILYHILTGSPPFQGASYKMIMEQTIRCSPADPREKNDRIDPALANICLKCLKNNPSERFPTAIALANELQSCRARPVELGRHQHQHMPTHVESPRPFISTPNDEHKRVESRIKGVDIVGCFAITCTWLAAFAYSFSAAFFAGTLLGLAAVFLHSIFFQSPGSKQ
jgi:eukaryotic-like serine/threonine-protein kinase